MRNLTTTKNNLKQFIKLLYYQLIPQAKLDKVVQTGAKNEKKSQLFL